MANENADVSSQASQNPVDRPAPQHPRPARYASTPSYESPQRHYRRNPIVRRPVKVATLFPSSLQDDGTAEHRINQYWIKQEIGRGSFGAVHLAIDQFGNEFAVKEFSKARLRKRAQSHLLRRPRIPKTSSDGFNSPLHRRPMGLDNDLRGNALYLIKEEIAIMKKLHHNNLVSLIEVLDDPTEDSLYMVMEMCKKGVIMKVGLEERADPYEDGLCRCWFRDLILGIEYLHAQGIVHRDIKPDNCLVTSDDVLKVVDFGVSEMFEKDSDMFTAKSAGSPAFLPPELCVVKHGDVSGKAADIWSMGVTLYCLRYGKLPFEKQSIFELYDAIKNDPIACEGETDDNFKNLMTRILEKDPAKRITMDELRAHPWVTRDGLDPLLSESENTAEIIGLPTEEEMNSAITKNIGHVLAVMKAVKNFKRLIDPAKAEPPMQSILGQEYESHFVQPPLEMEPEEDFPMETVPEFNKSQSLNTYDRRGQELDNVLQGYHQQREGLPLNRPLDSGSQTNPSGDVSTNTRSAVAETKDASSVRGGNIRDEPGDDMQPSVPQSPSTHVSLSRASSATTKRSVEGTRGHARDPLEEEFPFLCIGPSTYTGPAQPDADGDTDMEYVCDEPENISDTEAEPIVSESPGAAEFDIYETAYRQEIERIRKRDVPRQGSAPKVYLTRRVEGRDDMTKLVQQEEGSGTIPRVGKRIAVPSGPSLSFAVSAIRAQLDQQRQQQQQEQPPPPSKAADSHPGHKSPPPLSPSQVSESTTSSVAATGVSAAESSSPENSRTKLRSLLDRVRGGQ
ncbi:putative calcium/calmodulin dependent protein kinase [Aspergillus affinis]|uniref:putative calcium/calmodulin dependent protein kinase n=1 Tax=Aspergillus affinis TaxID=1070780 RepID=UPI0022FF2B78|nr:uncharacterized protein KD926_008473 [Aspergillus affinis]KAI9040272.1 hypothetical protein KD926_008473 [Aspergillus affinis]